MNLASILSYTEADTFGQGYLGSRDVSGISVSVVGVEGDFIATVHGVPEVRDIFGCGMSRWEAKHDLKIALRGAMSLLAGREPTLSPRLQRQLQCLRELSRPSETAYVGTHVSTTAAINPVIAVVSNRPDPGLQYAR